MRTDYDLMPIVTAERRAFSNVLESLSEQDWNTPSLCAGWRVREVLAHMTMPLRLSAPRFMVEMVRSGGSFARMADRVARRDAQVPTRNLIERWHNCEHTPWKPPGGGLRGALTHDIVHGLDITIPLGLEHPVTEAALRIVLDHATSPLSQKHFKLDLTDTRLEANDLDWAFGAGEPLRSTAHQLLMVLMDRRLPAGVLSGTAANRFTSHQSGLSPHPWRAEAKYSSKR